MFSQDTISDTLLDATGSSIDTSNPSISEGSGEIQTQYENACPQSLGIFGHVICFFKSSMGQILSTMYCSMQSALMAPFAIALELFIVIFGLAIITGMTNFTVREGIVAMLKIALVWAFAMNSSWGIGIGYTFFMGMAEEGAAIVTGAVGSGSGGGALLTQPDSQLQNVFNLISTGAVGSGLPSTLTPAGYSYSTCGLWLFVLLVLLLLFMPMVAGFIVVMILQYVILYVRAILGYLTAIVLISFLFILSPIFISFALFETTRPMFENWLKYLTSFSLQVVLIFGFLALLNLIPIGAFFYEILSLLRQTDTTQKSTLAPFTSTICSVCQYAINSSANIGDTPPPITCTSDTAIPLQQLFVSTDLVQTILSQIVALWIIGVVMHDFLKRAPEFARDLSGRLPFATILGGAGAGASLGGETVQYAGLDYNLLDPDDNTPIEERVDRLGQSISQSGSGRNSVMNRIAPVVGVAAAGLLLGKALSRGSRGPGSADPSSPPAGSRTSSPVGSGPSSPAPTTPRPLLVNAMRALQGYNTAEIKYDQAREVMDDSYERLQQALQTVERYKSSQSGDPRALHDALIVLKNANDTYLISTTNLYESQQRLLREKLKLLGGQVPANDPSGQGARGVSRPESLQRPDTVQGAAPIGELAPSASSQNGAAYAPSGNDGPADVSPDAGTDYNSPAMTEKLRTQARSSIDSLQLQINVQRHLLPADRIRSAQDMLNDALDALQSADTTSDVEEVLQQLYQIQRILI